MDRRDFLKSSCSLCVLAGAEVVLEEFSGCSPLPVYRTDVRDGAVTIPRSLFATHPVQIVRAGQVEYDIAVRMDAAGTFSALVLRCTHADTPLDASGNGYACPLHGSRFDAGGAVTRGPAEVPLEKCAVLVSGDDVTIIVHQNAGRAGKTG